MNRQPASPTRAGEVARDLKRRIPTRYRLRYWSVLNGLKRVRNMRYGLTNLENLWWDVHFGGIAGPTRASRYAHLGAHGVRNVSYRALTALFRHITIDPMDVLVDVGCGQGRVLNFWLRARLRNRLVGLEIDERVAAGVRARLKPYANVEVITGDAVENVPADASVFCLYNPFEEDVMRRFRDRLAHLRDGGRRVVVLYYAPRFANVFREDPAWEVRDLEMGRFEPACRISLRQV